MPFYGLKFKVYQEFVFQYILTFIFCFLIYIIKSKFSKLKVLMFKESQHLVYSAKSKFSSIQPRHGVIIVYFLPHFRDMKWLWNKICSFLEIDDSHIISLSFNCNIFFFKLHFHILYKNLFLNEWVFPILCEFFKSFLIIRKLFFWDRNDFLRRSIFLLHFLMMASALLWAAWPNSICHFCENFH